MDVRSADTTNLAAKRLELEKTQPVRPKPGSFPDDRLAAQATVEANGHVTRPKPPKDPRDEKKAGRVSRRPLAKKAPSAPEAAQADASDVDPAEHHILDVKV